MIAHPSDDLAARGTIVFCRRLSAAKEHWTWIQPEELQRCGGVGSSGDAAPKSSPFHATVFRMGGTVERYPLG